MLTDRNLILLTKIKITRMFNIWKNIKCFPHYLISLKIYAWSDVIKIKDLCIKTHYQETEKTNYTKG